MGGLDQSQVRDALKRAMLSIYELQLIDAIMLACVPAWHLPVSGATSLRQLDTGDAGGLLCVCVRSVGLGLCVVVGPYPPATINDSQRPLIARARASRCVFIVT